MPISPTSCPPPRCWRYLLLLLPLLLLAGCDRDEVTHYQVPRAPESIADKPKVRLLGAIVPHADDAWVFKLVGPVELITPQEEPFKSVLRSVKFSDKADAPLSWTTPQGWTEEKGPAPRHATLKQEKGPLELSISKLPARGADTLANVNRWRKLDLGLGGIGKGSLDRYTKEERLEGQPYTLVDMSGPGPGNKSSSKAKPMEKSGRSSPVTYTTPAGWTDTGPRGGMIPVLASFQISETDKRAEVTVLPLMGSTGGMLDNVNRWREQVSLPRLSADEFAKMDIPALKVGGSDAKLIDITGPRQRMLLALVTRGKRTWYFKMLGSAELVEKQKAAFESFLQSVKFTGAADE